jgi:hypothetical protein
VPVTCCNVAAHQIEVGAFVARIEVGQVLPAFVETEELEVELAELLATRCRPVLVGVLGEQFPAVAGERSSGAGGIPGGERGTCRGLERHGVDLDGGVGEQFGGVVPQHDRVGAAGGSTGEVGGLVQLRHGCVDIIVWPHRVEDFFAMHASAGGQGEEFDQRCRMSAGPAAVGHGAVVDGDLEPSEQPDPDLDQNFSHCSSASGQLPAARSSSELRRL